MLLEVAQDTSPIAPVTKRVTEPPGSREALVWESLKGSGSGSSGSSSPWVTIGSGGGSLGASSFPPSPPAIMPMMATQKKNAQ